jgi:hypothetical protein
VVEEDGGLSVAGFRFLVILILPALSITFALYSEIECLGDF